MPVTSTDEGFPIIFSLPAQGIKENFKDSEAIMAFLLKERDLWTQLAAEIPRPSFAGTNILHVAGQQDLQKAYVAARDAEDDTQIIGALAQYGAADPLVLQGTLGNVVFDRGDETDFQTSGVLWAISAHLGSSSLRTVSTHAHTARDLAAVSYGQAKVNSKVQNSSADRKRIQKLLEETNDKLNQATETNAPASEILQKIEEEVNAAVAKAKVERGQQLNATKSDVKRSTNLMNIQVAQLMNDTKLQLDETLRTSTEEIEEFKRKVRIDVGLEEPTNFWTDKANGHRMMAASFGAVFLLAVGVMVWWIESSAVGFVAEAVDRIVGDRTAAALSLVPIAFISVPALAFAWVLRHLSRIIIQNLSLEADARLRGTITKTFKALAADRAMNDAELAIALQALFRPIDGKDHSEIAPPSLADILKLGGDGKG